MAGASVGSTHRNRHGFHLLNSVEANRLVKEHTQVLQEERMFGLQGDGFTDKARKAQEAPNVRIANKNRGMPGKITSQSQFDLAENGVLLRIHQASAILQFILQAGVN